MNYKKIIFWLLLIIYALLLTHNINGHFNGSTIDYNSSLFGLTALNWFFQEPINSYFGQYINSQPYLNHPQFITLPLWLSYLVFGVGEWQTRLVPIIFSLGSLAIFWLLINLIFKDDLVTIGSSFIYIFLPASVYFGRMMSHESIARFFILLIIYLFLLFEKRLKKIYLAGLLIAIFAGGLVDWPIFYLLPALWFCLWLISDYPKRLLSAILISASFILSLLANIIHFYILSPDNFLDSLYGSALKHTSLVSLISLFVNKTYHEILNFTFIGIILTIFGCYYFWKQKNFKYQRLLILLVACPAVIHYVVFLGGKSHEFWSFYFTPFVALMIYWGLSKVRWSWLNGALICYFLASSLWQTYFILYPRSIFGAEDVNFVKKFSKEVKPDSLCLQYNNNDYNPSINFYLSREKDFLIENPLCNNSNYYLFKRWDQLVAKTDWEHYGILNKNYTSEIRTAGFELGTAISLLNKINWINQQLQNRFNDGQLVKNRLLENIKEDDLLISSAKLIQVRCSPNFCLYVSS